MTTEPSPESEPPLPESPPDNLPHPDISRGKEKIFGWMSTAFPPPQPLPEDGTPLPDDFDPRAETVALDPPAHSPFNQENMPTKGLYVMLVGPKENLLPFLQPLSGLAGIVDEVDPPSHIVHGQKLKNGRRGIMVTFPDADNRRIAARPEAFAPAPQ